MKIRLSALDPATSQSRIVLKKLPVLIGRSPFADVRVPDCWASRRHCELNEIDGTLVVRDVGSRHGTFVNGQLVAEATLLPGDRLTVGLSSYEVQYRRGRAAASLGYGASRQA
jgi:pSer/pThr/pTyr-binding forkhead associated (FHA) protein